MDANIVINVIANDVVDVIIDVANVANAVNVENVINAAANVVMNTTIVTS